MSFFFAFFAAFFLLSLGSAAGCLLCVLCGKMFHKPVLKSRLTVACVLLSVAVAVFAFSLLLAPELYASSRLFVQSVKENVLFLAALFSCGVLCAAFWRSVFPFVVSCYIALSIFTGVKLYGAFSANEAVLSLVVQNDAIKVNGTSYPVESAQGKALVLKRYTLPSVLLIPLPRVWYAVCGVSDINTEKTPVTSVSELRHFSGQAERPVSFSGEGDDVFMGGIVQSYRKWLLSSSEYQLVLLEDPVIYPSLYTIKIKTYGEKLTATFSRDL
ncbi:MAG: hypothetical protein IJS09_07055 [Treponema sp.]|nr:hypothetical protein [Treponema sp.]